MTRGRRNLHKLHLLVVHHHAEASEVENRIPGHIEYLEHYHQAGIFIASGPTSYADDGGAIIALGIELDEIRKITEEDPFFRDQLSTYEIVTINVRRSHPMIADVLEQLSIQTGK